MPRGSFDAHLEADVNLDTRPYDAPRKYFTRRLKRKRVTALEPTNKEIKLGTASPPLTALPPPSAVPSTR